MMKTKTIRPGRIFSGIVLVFWSHCKHFPIILDVYLFSEK